ncbi:hypothetical protein ABB55_06375 [Prosthecomicrobium hirschii]|uniref:Polysaccharide biosynthesis protein C-terminal domain-containing protein n=1 Tax=Prosthecodimorpha hirschii TaxID=665126 RepID=A0A0N8GEM0_9HYPH|nr:hypothetical protein ABB55_06375 [Prosthecomicrobium hirschii]
MVAIFFQVITVPVLLMCWGSEIYGIWILASTIPAFIAMSDVGLTTSATSSMIEKITAKDRAGANTIFLTTFFSLAAIAIVLSVIAIFLIQGVILPDLHFSDGYLGVRSVVTLLIFFGAAALISAAIHAGFCAFDRYATGTMLLSGIRLVESSSTICVALAGGSLIDAAVALVTIRALSAIGQGLLLFRLVPWLQFNIRGFSRQVLEALLRPSIATMAMPAALAVYLQGVPLVIGLAISPAMVTQFTVIRTMSRFPMQILSMFNHAILPVTARAHFAGDLHSIEKYVGLTILSSAVVGVGSALFLSVFGSGVIYLWTNGRIVPEPVLLFSLVAVMAVNVVWHPLSNLLMIVNHAAAYAPLFLALTAFAVLAVLAVLTVFGVWAIAMPLIALELIMLAIVLRGIGLVLFKQRNAREIFLAIWRATLEAF